MLEARGLNTRSTWIQCPVNVDLMPNIRGLNDQIGALNTGYAGMTGFLMPQHAGLSVRLSRHDAPLNDDAFAPSAPKRLRCYR